MSFAEVNTDSLSLEQQLLYTQGKINGVSEAADTLLQFGIIPPPKDHRWTDQLGDNGEYAWLKERSRLLYNQCLVPIQRELSKEQHIEEQQHDAISTAPSAAESQSTNAENFTLTLSANAYRELLQYGGNVSSELRTALGKATPQVRNES